MRRRDPFDSARSARRFASRGGSYQIGGLLGCGAVAEASQTYGDDLLQRARHLDRELMQLTHDDSEARRVLGRLAGRFIQVRGSERLGFARLGDYGAERLGWSGRQLQQIAQVATALARLPLIESAFRRGTLRWSKARLLACIASASDEEKWLAVAAATDVTALAAVTSSARAAAREQRRLPGISFAPASCGQLRDEPSSGASAGDCGCGDGAWTDPAAIDEEDHDERVLVSILCSQRARRMWNDARRYAPRMAGRVLAQWEVAELVAAEASSAPGPCGELWQQEPWLGIAQAQTRAEQRRASRAGDVAASRTGAASVLDQPTAGPAGATTIETAGERRPDANIIETAGACRPDANTIETAGERGPDATTIETAGACRPDQCSPDPDQITSPIAEELARLEELDAFELDAAMRRVRSAMQQRQSRLGSALGLFLELGLHGQLGYARGADYIRERLGMSERTARELVRVAQVAQSRSSVLASAYAGGELSWLRTLALLSVVRPWNASAWVQRAGEVTLRRLADEVAWATERADLDPQLFAAMPPAPGQRLHLDDDERQKCAQGTPAGQATANPCDTDRQFCARDTRADKTTNTPGDTDRQICAQGTRADQATNDPGDTDRQFCARDTPADKTTNDPGDTDRQFCAQDTSADQATNDPDDTDRQICARDTRADKTTTNLADELWGITGRIHVTFLAPLSVSVLFRTVMQSFAAPTEPRWKAFERMLERVLGQWRSQPRHRDPVFARDGHRCSAPGCSSLANLHDHHIVPRSAGGTNELTNRTTLCAWHHLRAVHGGLARATGQAPDAIDWELGIAAERPPLMRLRGDRYLGEQPASRCVP
ncbi:MAG: HNH endonuclease, partial [Deltaproteobacteria bacterium]|nr:HNH endonuclease [Deltaproteobacteria bacterium]